MSVHRKENGRWEVRYREGTRNRSKTFERKADASSFDAQQRLARQRGDVIRRREDVPGLDEFAREWALAKARSGKADATIDYDASLLDVHILPHLGHLSLLDLRPRRLDAWQRDLLAAGVKPYTLQRAAGVLGQILDRAVRLEYVDGNAARSLERPAHRRRRGRAASPVQVEAMRAFLLERDRVGDAALVSTLAYVGLRPAEALALSWDDVDLKRRRARIRFKNVDGKLVEERKGRAVERTAGLPQPAAAELAHWRLALQAPEGLVWPRASDDLPWRKTDWGNWRSRWFARSAGAAGLLQWNAQRKRFVGDFVPYDLRHTCASLKIRAGEPPAEIAAHLGHSLRVLFDTYAHEIEAMRGQPQRPVDELVREARSGADVRPAFDAEVG